MALNPSGKTDGTDRRGDFKILSLPARARTVGTLPPTPEENQESSRLVRQALPSYRYGTDCRDKMGERHREWIWVESELAGGTSAAVRLKLVNPSPKIASDE